MTPNAAVTGGSVCRRDARTTSRVLIVVLLAGGAAWAQGVTPVADQFQVNKISMEVSGKTVSDKAIYYTTDPETDEVVKLEVDPERRKAQSLLDKEIVDLAELGKRIEKHYGKPMDIEWAVEKSLPYKGETFIVQSRPETVWSQKEVKPVIKPRASALEHIVAGLMEGRKLK